MKRINYRNLALVNGFRVVQRGESIWKSDHHLLSLTHPTDDCPVCHTHLQKDQTRIPVDAASEAIIPVHYCPHCKKSYVEHTDRVSSVMRDNFLAKGYTVDGVALWNASEKEKYIEKIEQKHRETKRRKEALQAIESSVVMICVQFRDCSEREYIIVNNPRDAVPENDVLHYSSEAARELLSAAFHKGRRRKGSLNAKKYYVTKTFFEDGPHTELPADIAPTELVIEAGGGLYSSLVNKCREIVDMLLFSPFTGRYEIIKATYNKDQEYSFVDICLYRNHAKKYGNPGVSLFFERTKAGKGDWNQLNAESFLKGYGYSVSQADGMSREARHAILAELIDLELLTAEKILGHLDFTIRTHPQDKDSIPRLKWAEDKIFVENYRADPLRFMLAK